MPRLKKVLIGPSTFAAADPAPLEALESAGYAVVANPYKRKLTKPELLVLLSEEVVGLIAGLEPLDREVLEKSRLQAISRCGSGMTNVDLTAAKALGIEVRSTPEAPVESVAELTLGAMLSLLRAISPMDQDLRSGRWEKRTGALLEGKTVAVVGFGRIGRRVAELLRPFRVRLLAVDPALRDDVDGVIGVSLKEALGRADIVTLHCSGEDEVIGPAELAAMKPGAFLLNAARGGLIDEVGLAQALEEGRIAGAWLDVFGEEPYRGPLTRSGHALLTPHVGSYTVECRRGMELEAAENLIAALSQAGVRRRAR